MTDNEKDKIDSAILSGHERDKNRLEAENYMLEMNCSSLKSRSYFFEQELKKLQNEISRREHGLIENRFSGWAPWFFRILAVALIISSFFTWSEINTQASATDAILFLILAQLYANER